MTTFLEAAGLVAWPLLILAAATLWQSVRYLGTARAQHLVAAAGSAVLSLTLSLLWFLVGLQYSVATAVRPGVHEGMVLLGLSEALHGVVLALLTCLLATLLLSIGGYRAFAAANPADRTATERAPSRA